MTTTDRTESGTPRGALGALRALRRDLGPDELGNGLVGLLFSITGPVAVILAVARTGDLPQSVVASWIFAVFALNGGLTIVAALVHRQPLCFFWTIPGTVLVGQALASGLRWSEVVGAYVLTAALVLLVGLTGRVDRVMGLLPMPIVMAMVAGVFLQFGLGLVTAVGHDVAVAAPMVVTFLLCTAVPAMARRVPPILAALVVGAGVVLLAGRLDPAAASGDWVVTPVWQVPEFTGAAAAELVVPLAITVLVVQNGQGMAVLRDAGHRPPMNQVTLACGVLSFPTALLGGVSTCLTGPTNALLTASGDRDRHYAAAVWCGLLAIGFGIVAPGMVRLMSATPTAFVAVLGGLAMLRALQGAFTTAFSGPFGTGALLCFLVTVADVTVLNVGAAFWGLVVGLAVSALLEADDFRRR
ncbi:benzoate/H(+) symporter BenE family transporter [Nocardioides panacisoli]|uniref:benzoate/H(+) symporter BenE family transporter n=1 Tax=Nocardioides panacisoli TaxID=627624 RepID=UPI001C625DF1|nr:benzoate/H(+) symporter BenE family transporter [Nocardioides panacisoli]QYJ03069.1 benzoate/H(+) symporter BenE family transporter [Nocardioides panacisoli]